MFESLAERLQATFKKLRGHGKLTENDINVAMREIRMALLEADVNYKVVKSFVADVKAKALGRDIMDTLTPAQAVVKIVYDELTALMGGQQAKLAVADQPPTVVMLVGLQGSGKTTTAGKLALSLRKAGKRPLLVADDIYRPAAVNQLQTLGKQLDVPVFAMDAGTDAVTIARSSLAFAESRALDTVIIDTAGRLHVNEELMRELRDVKGAVSPHEILLVVDAMTGQDAVAVAEAFHADLALTGLVLTKMDGDARGGAALSVKAVTGCPIKFTGTGEKLDALQPFYPDRMASRILDMGDVLTLIDKATEAYDAKSAKDLQKKLRRDEFTLEDFLEQLQQVRKMGSFEQLLGMLPGMGNMKKQLEGADVDFNGKEMKRVEAIIRSMTPKERNDIGIINGSRRKRIALGSGTRVQDVNRLLKQFAEMRKLMKQMKKLQAGGKGLSRFKLPFKIG